MAGLAGKGGVDGKATALNAKGRTLILMLGVFLAGLVLMTGTGARRGSSTGEVQGGGSTQAARVANAARGMGQRTGHAALAVDGTEDVVVAGVPPRRARFGMGWGNGGRRAKPNYSMGNRMGAIKSYAVAGTTKAPYLQRATALTTSAIADEEDAASDEPHYEFEPPSAEECERMRAAAEAMNTTVKPALASISVGEAGTVKVGAGVRPYDELFEHTLQMISCNVPFAHVSLTIAEAKLINGKPFSTPELLANHGMMLPSHDLAYQQLRSDLMNVLQHSEPSFKFGVPIPPCKEGMKESDPHGGGDVSSLVTFLGHMGTVGSSDHHLFPRLSYADLFSHKNYAKAAAFFTSLLDTRSDVRLYALGNFFRDAKTSWADRTVQLPPDLIEHWPLWRPRIIEDARKMAMAMNDQHTVFLFDAGPVGKYIIDAMYSKYPQHTYVDISGLLDEAHGGRKRNPEKFYTGDRGRRFDDGALTGSCTFSRYVRVGDCVTVALPGDGVTKRERLEPLVPECFSKGAKGKPLASRVGGYFHDNVAKLMRKSAEGAARQKGLWSYLQAPDPEPKPANTMTMQASASKKLPDGWGYRR